MSIEKTKAVLKDFLSNDKTDVLALTGAWGSGKTHVWRECLLSHKGSIKFEQYCYVSLFGVSNMAELRMMLFTKSVAVETLGKKTDLATLKEHFGSRSREWLKEQYARFRPLLASLPHGSSIALGLDAFAPSAVRDTLVCFDDFERQTKISAEEILGLITELREERGCKVALIFNADQLAAIDAYRACREKAIDIEVKYEPTAREAFDLVFPKDFLHREITLRHVADLGITNVRILHKLRRVLELITRAADGLHDKVIESSISSAVLLCWCSFAPDPSKPKFEEIGSWNKALMSIKKEEEQDPTVLAWAKRLRAYGFTHVDDLDLTVARVVESGYVEFTGFDEAAKRLDEDLRSAGRENAFSEVWHRFRNTFSDEEEVFIKDLYASARHAISQIGVNDLNSTVRLLRELKRDDLADGLVDEFVQARKGKPSAFDLKNHPFGGSIDDAKLRAAFDAAFVELNPLPSLEDAVKFMVENSGYNQEQIDAMKSASEDDYFALFMKQHVDVSLQSLVKWSLRWDGTDHSEISAKARAALERIKATNPLNAVRVNRLGA